MLPPISGVTLTNVNSNPASLIRNSPFLIHLKCLMFINGQISVALPPNRMGFIREISSSKSSIVTGLAEKWYGWYMKKSVNNFLVKKHTQNI